MSGPQVFRVEPGIFQSFPGMILVVAVVESLRDTADREGIRRLWRESWAAASALEVQNAQSHSRVAAWREHFRAIGVSMKKFPTSIEAMLRRALKGGPPFEINPVVDFYNALSMRYVCPAGAFDLGQLEAQALELRLTRAGDRFTALDTDETVDVPSGEIAYACGPVVLTRHFMWRQSREGLVDERSRRVFFVSEIPSVAGPEVARAMERDLVGGLEQHFGSAAQSFLLSESLTQIDL